MALAQTDALYPFINTLTGRKPIILPIILDIKKKQNETKETILSADFWELGKQIEEIGNAGAQYVHIDVMDGSFVPQISYGQPVVKSLRPLTNLVFDVHLMIDHPENHIQSFADSGADYITFHVESTDKIDSIIDQIHKLNKSVFYV